MGDWCGSVSTDQNQKDRDNGRETAENTGGDVKIKKEENFLIGEVFFVDIPQIFEEVWAKSLKGWA